MSKILAKVFSIVFHPILLPTIGMIILFNSGSVLEFIPYQAKKVILLIVFFSTAVLPLTFVPFFVFQKIVKSVQMDDAKERLIPFAVTSILYAFSYYLLIRLGAPNTIAKFILIGAITVFALFILSFFWKISAHMAGLGGLFGALIAVSFNLNVNLEYYIIPVAIISGLLGFSRLLLNKHRPYQIYSGWILGMVVALIVLFI
jgi:hypothetical protein